METKMATQWSKSNQSVALLMNFSHAGPVVFPETNKLGNLVVATWQQLDTTKIGVQMLRILML